MCLEKLQTTEPITYAPFFPLMADETTDISNKEQLVICFRWVDEKFIPHEEFVGLYEIENIEANTIFSSIQDTLRRNFYYQRSEANAVIWVHLHVWLVSRLR
jgi:hypothetical protein